MSAQHTPGTWHAARWSTHEPTTVRTADPSIVTGWRVVAECDTVETARLVAVAPDLLEACRTLAEWLAREDDHAVDFYARIELCNLAQKQCLAAIARATGAAP